MGKLFTKRQFLLIVAPISAEYNDMELIKIHWYVYEKRKIAKSCAIDRVGEVSLHADYF